MPAVIASGYSHTTASPPSSPASAKVREEAGKGRSGPSGDFRLDPSRPLASRSRSRSRHTSTNAAKLRRAARTCEKYSVENGSTSVAVPSVIAVATPVPGAIRSAPRATSQSSSTAGATTPSRPSAHAIGASSAIVSRACIARARSKPYCSIGSVRAAHGAPPSDSARTRASCASDWAPVASSRPYSGSVANTSPGGLTE